LRLLRTLPVLAAAALLLSACGSQGGATGAENAALSTVKQAHQVLSYPIKASPLEAYMPTELRTAVGTPCYLFALSVTGQKQPVWVVAGESSAHTVHIYQSIADLYTNRATFGISGTNAASFQVVATSPAGKLHLKLIGVRVRSVTQAQLSKIGVKVPAGSYNVVSVLSLPPTLHAPTAEVANFVVAGGKIALEYGTTR
jgi:hypothetical protein